MPRVSPQGVYKYLLYFLSLLTLLTLIFALWLYILFNTSPISSDKNPITFIVPKNASVFEIANLLQTQGINQKTYYSLLLAKSLGRFNQIKAGEYQIAPDATPRQLIGKLAKGQRLLHKITFPEGWTFTQMMTALASEPRLSHTVQTNADVMKALGDSNENPEGMFYPDTYLFTLATKDTQIFSQAYDLMQKKLAQAWTERAQDLPYKTPYEALIVASLIEKEAFLAKERPIIAGVILRRLKIGMRLQIDAAVSYGLKTEQKEAEGTKNHRLTRSDLLADTPYNTYTRNGLPPTPIAMPGIASINAALHPASGTALYYVAKGDGSHIFSDSLQGHQTAVQAYRAQQHLAEDAHYLQPYKEVSTSVQLCISSQLLLGYWHAFLARSSSSE